MIPDAGGDPKTGPFAPTTGPEIEGLMTPDPWVVAFDAPIVEAAYRMVHHRIRHVPVVDAAGRLYGILLDFAVRAGAVASARAAWSVLDSRAPSRTCGELAVPVQVIARPESPIVASLRTMLDRREDVIVVVDVGLHPVGIVTEHDVVRLAERILPDSESTATAGSAPVYAIEWTKPASEAYDIMVAHKIRHVLVTDGGQLVGVLAYRDLVADGLPMKGDRRVGSVLPRGLVFRFEGDHSLREAAHEMATRKIGCIPITDEWQRPLRVITRSDIVESVMEALANDDLAIGP